jgi:RecA-family ATPase
VSELAFKAWSQQARAVPIEDELARRGINLRGKIERVGPCPKCGGDDRFSINTGKQVFNCRVCDVGGDVIDLVQHLDGVDFTVACTTLTGEPKPNGSNGKDTAPPPIEIVAAKYTYEDEKGAPLLIVGRIEYQNADKSFVLKDGKHKKSFRQARPDPDRPGKYLHNVDGVRIVPYKLPAIIEAIGNGHPIFIVEGEAKADLLWSWNVPATCCAAGAKKWRPEHSEFLRGADVVVLPDNDAPGHEHADIVAASLRGVASSIRVIDLPGLGAKQDIIDWARDGGTVEHLHELAAAAPIWAPNKANDQPPDFADVSSALAFVDPTTWDGQQIPPRRWLVPHRIPLANVTMLTGDGASGKTTIALQLAAAAVRGTDWLGSMIEASGPAIFFTAEEDEDEMHRRLAALVEHLGISFRDLAPLRLLCMPGANAVLGEPDRSEVIQPTPLFNKLSKAAIEIRPSLIVVEAAADVYAGNENNRAQVRQFIALLRRLALDSGAAVLLISHPSLTGMASGTGSSGSTAWNNSVRSRLYFAGAKRSNDDDDESDIRELRVMKSNYGPAGEVVRLRWQRGVFVAEGSPGGLERVAAEAAVEDAYLACLDATLGSGRHVGPYAGRAYAPAIFEKMPQARSYRAKALAAAQERLFNAGRIEVVKIGPPSKALDRIFRKAS